MGRATASGEPASNKREAVLAAAVRCFAAHGLAGTGMRDIAAAAGLTEGTLYHYFPSKDALIEAAFQWSAFQASDVEEIMRRPELSLRARLLAVGREFHAALRRDPHWTRVVLREALRAPSRDRNPVRGALVALAAGRTRALIAALRGEMRAERIVRCDARRVAEHLFHALIGQFVADAIVGAERSRQGRSDPFLVHLVETIARDLERGTLRSVPATRRDPRVAKGRTS
jgi:AcrR family transcriptional regulator